MNLIESKCTTIVEFTKDFDESYTNFNKITNITVILPKSFKHALSLINIVSVWKCMDGWCDLITNLNKMLNNRTNYAVTCGACTRVYCGCGVTHVWLTGQINQNSQRKHRQTKSKNLSPYEHPKTQQHPR